MSELINEASALGNNKLVRAAQTKTTNARSGRSKPDGQQPDDDDSVDFSILSDQTIDPQIDPSRTELPIDPTLESLASRPLIWVSETHLDVLPGQTVRLKVNVRNVGTVVETYALTVLGPARHWITALPAEISLFPGEEGSATLIVKPPRTPSMLAGQYEVGVKATSHVLWTERAVAEFTVKVAPYHQFKSAISRSTIEMRRQTSTFIHVVNEGNSAVVFDLDITDPDGRIKSRIEESRIPLDPGQPVWVRAQIIGPVKFIGRTYNGALLASTTQVLDLATNSPVVDTKPFVQRVSIVQRPLLRFRLGWFGRMLILVALMALLLTFVISRFTTTDVPPVTGAPEPPSSVAAALQGTTDVILTWNPSSGATGYHIYAVGTTADASSSPGATGAASSSATSSDTATVGAGPIVDLEMKLAANVVAEDNDATTSPSGSSTKTDADDSKPPTGAATEGAKEASPVCINCTSVTAVAAGTTRYVVQGVKPDIKACYRVVAIGGEYSSLYSPEACVQMPTAKVVAAAAASASAAANPPPCAPIDTSATEMSDSQVGLQWRVATKAPKPSAGSTQQACKTSVTINGWLVQRQVLDSWTGVTPAPGANDTAMEIPGLSADTKYCFRMRATTNATYSVYTKKVCATTSPSPTPSPTATDSSSASPSPTNSDAE